MERKIDRRDRMASWAEYIMWNAAAVALVGAMLVVLLFSISWLDRVHPPASHGPSVGESRRAVTDEVAINVRSAHKVHDRPDG